MTSQAHAGTDLTEQSAVADGIGEELVCPMSRGALERRRTELYCASSGRSYPLRADWIDFLPDVPEDSHSVASALMHLPPFARVYEQWWRPTYVTATRGERSDIEREVGWVERELEPCRGGSIVDISCGPGTVGRRLARTEQFERVHLLDHSEAMLSQCARLARREGLSNAVLMRADASYLPFADASLAGAHVGNAMHVWEHPQHAISEIGRVLRPGGVFVSSVFVRPKERAARLLAATISLGTAMHVFEETALRNMIMAVGFDDVRTTRQGVMVRLSARRV